MDESEDIIEANFRDVDNNSDKTGNAIVLKESEPVKTSTADLIVEINKLRKSDTEATHESEIQGIENELRSREVHNEWFAEGKNEEHSDKMVEMFVESYPRLQKRALEAVPSIINDDDQLQKEYVGLASKVKSIAKDSLSYFRMIKFSHSPNSYDGNEIFNSKCILELHRAKLEVKSYETKIFGIKEKVSNRKAASNTFQDLMDSFLSDN